MSQHLITQFINRSTIFKPINGAKLINQKLKKYQGSNRQNNNSPEELAESIHNLQNIKVPTEKKSEQEPHSTVDITV